MTRELPDATVRYAEHTDAVVDVHLPREVDQGTDRHAAGRVVVLLHGGFWKPEWDRRHTRTMARALADAGWVVAAPEYRRVRAGGGWPVSAQDVHLAVSRLPGLLRGLGLSRGLADTRLTVTGHSAGGHLALWLATTGLELARVVALAPVCDLTEAIRLDLGDGAAAEFLGGQASGPADPMELLEDRPAFPVSIVHGEDDDVVPAALSRGLVARHPWVDLTVVPGDHFAVIEPGSAAWPTVLAQLAGPT